MPPLLNNMAFKYIDIDDVSIKVIYIETRESGKIPFVKVKLNSVSVDEMGSNDYFITSEEGKTIKSDDFYCRIMGETSATAKKISDALPLQVIYNAFCQNFTNKGGKVYNNTISYNTDPTISVLNQSSYTAEKISRKSYSYSETGKKSTSPIYSGDSYINVPSVSDISIDDLEEGEETTKKNIYVLVAGAYYDKADNIISYIESMSPTDTTSIKGVKIGRYTTAGNVINLFQRQTTETGATTLRAVPHTTNYFDSLTTWVSITGVPSSEIKTTGDAVHILKDSTIENINPDDAGEPSTDPYNPDGESGTGGGTGDFNGESDNIPVPELPGISAVDTGFVGIFKPSLTQVKALADYMWSDLFSVDSFKKVFADPMDCILGFSIVPVSVPGSETGTVKVGNISTGVSMTKASSQYVSLDCGSLSINEFWGSFLDYAPHTKISLYLPYIGFRTINTDEVMGATLGVIYHVDILTGALVAYVTRNSSVLCTYEGACAANIPLSANDWTQTINGIISLVSSGVTAAATGGAGAGAAIAKAAGSMALSGAQNMASLKPRIEHSGSVSGAGGILAVQTPYILAERPNQCLPANQNKYSGYPSFVTAKIGSLTGFTKISEINPTGISATEEEMNQIITNLKNGVII